MSPTAVPTRITIDFRDAIHPSRTWILGIGDDGGRADLLTFDQPLTPLPRPIALTTACTCPDFCERDHANE
jgi:hypothetical protein